MIGETFIFIHKSKIIKSRGPVSDSETHHLGEIGGFRYALPTLHNTLIFQLLKYLCLTMIGETWGKSQFLNYQKMKFF